MTSVETTAGTLSQLDFQLICSVGHDHDTHLDECANVATHMVIGHDCIQPDADENGYIERTICQQHVDMIERLFLPPYFCRACGRVFHELRAWFPRIVRL